MLPSCDRVLRASRATYLPSTNRGIPVPKNPTNLGGHLRRRRLELRLVQAEAAGKLGVSTVTLSKWECDRRYPAWTKQAKVVAYLGYNPFDDPMLGRPLANETPGVAFVALKSSRQIGDRIRLRRLQLRKTRSQLAHETGLSLKTLWNWEHHKRTPSPRLRGVIMAALKLK